MKEKTHHKVKLAVNVCTFFYGTDTDTLIVTVDELEHKRKLKFKCRASC